MSLGAGIRVKLPASGKQGGDLLASYLTGASKEKALSVTSVPDSQDLQDSVWKKRRITQPAWFRECIQDLELQGSFAVVKARPIEY